MPVSIRQDSCGKCPRFTRVHSFRKIVLSSSSIGNHLRRYTDSLWVFVHSPNVPQVYRHHHLFSSFAFLLNGFQQYCKGKLGSNTFRLVHDSCGGMGKKKLNFKIVVIGCKLYKLSRKNVRRNDFAMPLY